MNFDQLLAHCILAGGWKTVLSEKPSFEESQRHTNGGHHIARESQGLQQHSEAKDGASTGAVSSKGLREQTGALKSMQSSTGVLLPALWQVVLRSP